MNFFAQLLITTAYVSTCIHYFWITSSGRKAIFIQCYIMVSTWWPHYPSINVLLASITLFKTITWIGLFHPDSFQWSIWNFACSRLSIQLKCVYVPLLQAFLVSMVDQSADPKATFEALGRRLFSMEEQSSLSVTGFQCNQSHRSRPALSLRKRDLLRSKFYLAQSILRCWPASPPVSIHTRCAGLWHWEILVASRWYYYVQRQIWWIKLICQWLLQRKEVSSSLLGVRYWVLIPLSTDLSLRVCSHGNWMVPGNSSF